MMPNETRAQSRLDAERAVIGCMMIDDRAIDSFVRVGGVASAAWFSDHTCRRAATSILSRHSKGMLAADPLAIMQDTQIAGEWVEAVMAAGPIPAHAGHYCRTLAGHAELARMEGFIHKAAARIAQATAAEADDLKAMIEADLHRLLSTPSEAGLTLAERAHNWIDQMTAPEGDCMLLDWPCRCITDHMGRLEAELVWLCAQPSAGKTAFVLQWMAELALRGITTSMASLESRLDSIVSRLIAQLVPMDTYPIRQRRATPGQIADARRAADQLTEAMRITDAAMTLDQVYAWGRAEKRKGSRLLIVDNTRHIRMPAVTDRIAGVSEISVRMKQLRDDTGLPVVVLHHSKLDDKGNEDVSWSQDVRRDADLLLFLKEDKERTRYPTGVGDPGLWCVNFDVAKHREGRKNVRVSLRFVKEHQRFEPWTA
jgi:replicative DNA helicase